MSTRMTFTLKTLQEQIKEQRDRRVQRAEAAYQEAVDLPARRAEWREVQERRVRHLAETVSDLKDSDLERFSIPAPPSVNRYQSPEDARTEALAKADAAMERANRRLDALHAPDGTVSLTASMMSDWFGL